MCKHFVFCFASAEESKAHLIGLIGVDMYAIAQSTLYSQISFNIVNNADKLSIKNFVHTLYYIL